MYRTALNFANTDGRVVHWNSDWSSAVMYEFTTDNSNRTGEDIYGISGFTRVYQEPRTEKAASIITTPDPITGKPRYSTKITPDGGYFYFVKDGGAYSVGTPQSYVSPEGMPHVFLAGETMPQPQCVGLVPSDVLGSFDPKQWMDPSHLYSQGSPDWASGRFVSGFLVDTAPASGWLGSNPSYPLPPSTPVAALTVRFDRRHGISWNLGDVHSLWHYEPWAWYGDPIRVIHSIALRTRTGVSLDKFLFDIAARSYTIDPWLVLSDELTIHFARKIGNVVADDIVSILRHTRDMMFFTMAGDLGVMSRQWPLSRPALTADDGILKFEFGHTSDYVMNSVDAYYGSGFVLTGFPGFSEEATWTQGDTVAMVPSAQVLSSTREALVDTWKVEGSDSTSISIHGDRKNAVPDFPYMLQADGDLPHLTRWLSLDADPAVYLEVEQTMLGCAYDLGWEIASVELTDEIQTDRRRMTCIRKTIDFDSLTVRSLLVERKTIDTDAFESSWSGDGDFYP